MFTMMLAPAAQIILISGNGYNAENEHLIAAVNGNRLDYFWGAFDLADLGRLHPARGRAVRLQLRPATAPPRTAEDDRLIRSNDSRPPPQTVGCRCVAG